MTKSPKNLPDHPGVYLYQDKQGRVIYVGKAASLKARVSSYWKNPDQRIQELVKEIHSVDYKKTPTVIEALILEANLIKELKPKYNIKGKDNKTFLYVLFLKEDFPTPILVREHELQNIPKQKILSLFGPFTSATYLKKALSILRGIFPWACPRATRRNKPCFYYQIKRCSGVCVGEISKKDYLKIIKNLILFFEGKKEKIIKNLEKEMKNLAKKEEFEKAKVLRDRIIALEHIKDIALLRENDIAQFPFKRIEGYDISNISGKLAVGSMVVFTNRNSDKNEYRKFKIKTIDGPNDTAMLAEVIERRFKNDWKKPDLILIDGGKGQVNATQLVLDKLKIKIPIVGIAKGEKRKNNILVLGKNVGNKDIISPQVKNILIQVRDEAHRFAIKYHRKLRGIK